MDSVVSHAESNDGVFLRVNVRRQTMISDIICKECGGIVVAKCDFSRFVLVGDTVQLAQEFPEECPHCGAKEVE